ncbi:MAG: MOSC domain-containing protein [Alphaproteobacteria bacterium]|nr:MAG: MOSC domain-containing protein [Alphaproteobacteria bacterium]
MPEPRLGAIYRYPVKGLGPDAPRMLELSAGRHLPGDRVWALAHARSAWDADRPAHVARRNFVQTADSPALARTSLAFDGRRVTVSAPGAADLTVDPDREGEALAEWVARLADPRQPGPYRIARLPGGALTDVAEAHVSLHSEASLRALSQAVGIRLEHRRFRGNLWLDGLGPWEEFELIGRDIRIGPVRLRVIEPITRCIATSASPASGRRDVDVTGTLHRNWGHADFGVYAQIVEGGTLRIGDPLVRL